MNQANGSTPASSQEATKLRSTGMVLTPRSLPMKVQLGVAEGNAAQAPLGVVVIDGQVAGSDIARQRRPGLQRAGNRLARRTPRQHFFANGLQIPVQFIEHRWEACSRNRRRSSPAMSLRRACFSILYKSAMFASAALTRAASVSSVL